MKVAILSCANLSRAQYIYKYLQLLDNYGCDYDVIFWNRTLEDIDVECNAHFISYDRYIDSYKPFYMKIVDYLKFSAFVNKMIKKNKYDKLIILTTPMMISVISNCFGKYRKKYLYDFRDLTKEYIYLYKKIVQKAIDRSGLFVTSSPGYAEYLNLKREWVLCHNTLSNITFKKNIELSKRVPISISYWGAIRQIEYNKKICDIFGNDERFKFVYHGDGANEELRRYCEEKKYKNIFFTGRYLLRDLAKFARETDILFNAYATDFVTTPSLAVKVYDSIEYRLPMIISKGTFMEKYLGGYTYAFVFEADKRSVDSLFQWYMELECEELKEDFDTIFRIVETDDRKFENELKRFLLKYENEDKSK